MAEAVVGVLLGKLSVALMNEAATYASSIICKESSELKALFGEIRKAEGELEIMKAYLHDSEKLKDTNEIAGIFVNKIRDLAFRIEDVVDEFAYKIEDNKQEGFRAKMKKMLKNGKTWRRLALELRDINCKLEDAAKRKDLYAMPGMERGARDCDHHARTTNQTSCFARDEDLVGIQDNAEKLKRWLVGDFEERYKIATVWGMGGVGKTSLVDYVYRIVKVEFDAAAWITVSKSYKVEELLRKVAREFGITIDVSNMELRSLVEVIRSHLKGKRYILVLDDIWEKDLWINKIMDVFPTNWVSRFVFTSRKYEVASLATRNCAVKLDPMGENHSWKLFCRLAFRNNDEKSCPIELHDLAMKFLRKCEGLPIAIACIGRLLSCKPSTLTEWNNVYEELELQSTNNVIPGVDTILKVSLEDLPYELKNCFLHCAIFPEDCLLKRKRLIRHWITAGFIKKKESKTLEEVAEGCLNELVNRSLLQVVKKNEFGRVKCCRMHDIIHHLALEKAKEECFGKVYEGPETFSVDSTRRLSIQSTNIEPLCQSGVTHLRAIHAFTSDVDIDLLRPIFMSSHLLSTLDLQGTKIKMLPNEVFNLFNLRFLGLRYTEIEILPKALGRLKNLEVLDALFTPLLSLPEEVVKLQRLWFLYACTLHKERTLQRYGGIKVPRTIRNLTGLHAMETIEATLETLCDVASLTELRAFSVCDVKSEHSLNLCRAIMNMSHLVHLSIAALDENQVLPLEALCLPGTLSKLVLQGWLEKKRMPRILSSWLHLNNLSKLSLIFSKLDEDSFSSLKVLGGLCYLELVKAYDGKKLFFSALSFPRLRRLAIWSAQQLNRVEIEEGALESLEELMFTDCPELNCLPYGIEFLKDLEELRLEDTAEELIEKLRQESRGHQDNEELVKISHIRKVVIILSEKNIRERIR
ncbi:hypothetical protein SEVIR_8G066500v4 [Setaria viridis]|uniref:NB-ARC domain-containing protein n=1 Tax=Setaria viridis TaxID=4556 RepID=A0A4V6D2V2_SETVI|nr:hypothetical protein SEVIR_8G066500v2 [Setaria viridis]TKV99785.1 hypothetical protein SEVIR_8G066500v2 [Setaria viridis]